MKLRHLIIQKIVKYFGVLNVSSEARSKKFLLNKKVSIEFEDDIKEDRELYGAIGKIAKNTIRVLATQISATEYVCILQFDNLSIYAISVDTEKPDEDNVRVFINGNWVILSDLLLAKLLVGVEQLNEMFVEFLPITNFEELYEHLILFLNYETGNT